MIPKSVQGLLFLLALSTQATTQLNAEPAGSPPRPDTHDIGAEILEHRLEIALTPKGHHLAARDRITVVCQRDRTNALLFRLSPALEVQRVEQLNGEAHRLEIRAEPAGREPRKEGQLVRVLLNPPIDRGERITLVWQYQGIINDPPREAGHLRFVTPSETNGHIGLEGVYLSAETGWYPALPGSLSRFSVTVTVPEGWAAVTQGRRVSTQSGPDGVIEQWEDPAPAEALTLVANRYVARSRQWQDVQVGTYLFPDNANLADEYLDAAVRYLQTYSNLLGPYPHRQFAIVENFFPSGLGMPSFTLLGSGVIKRHYVQPYALGHEIVHSWIGNWVLNDPDSGNWVEGLTTYLANYYFDEWSGRLDEAREQRRLMLLGYAVYVRPESDYPIKAFKQKTDQKDNAIGYQKAAMVFHMLRREIGEDAFWKGLKVLVAERSARRTTWADLEDVFARTAGRDLRWFFSQWVERPGAPSIALDELHTSEAPGEFKVRVVQRGPVYRVRVPLLLELENGERHASEVVLASANEGVTMAVRGASGRVRLDPDFELFRRMEPDEIPPMLNLFVTDRQRTVIMPAGEGEQWRPYQDVAARLASQNENGKVVLAQGADPEAFHGSVLVLGGPESNPAAAAVGRLCLGKVALEPDGFTIDGHHYQGKDLALLVSCRQARQPGSVVTWFYGTTSTAAQPVARLLFFYGWQSYLVFRDGAVIARGDFLTIPRSLEAQIHGR